MLLPNVVLELLVVIWGLLGLLHFQKRTETFLSVEVGKVNLITESCPFIWNHFLS